jgi:hypothetical protein
MSTSSYFSGNSQRTHPSVVFEQCKMPSGDSVAWFENFQPDAVLMKT